MGKGAQKGDFIGGEPTNSNVWQAGKVVPTVAAHPMNFLMPRDDTRCQEKPGKQIPTAAASGRPPDQAGILVCHPDSCRSLILATFHIRKFW